MSDRDTIERAIRHIDSCLDVDPWARDIAIDAMQRLLEQASYRQITGKLDGIYDAISRVYNMPDVPDEAKSIIGDVMLGLPSVQPEVLACGEGELTVQPERKTGNWTRISMDKYTQHAQAWYRCSECQGEFIGKWNYCPNCGADMRGENNE